MIGQFFYWCRACRQPLYATRSLAIPAGRDWEIDLPNAPRVLRPFGS